MEVNVINPEPLSIPKSIVVDTINASYLPFKPWFGSIANLESGVIANTAQGAAYPSIGWEWTLANLSQWNSVWWAGHVQTTSLQELFPNLGWDVEVPAGYRKIVLLIDGFSNTLAHVAL